MNSFKKLGIIIFIVGIVAACVPGIPKVAAIAVAVPGFILFLVGLFRNSQGK